MEERKIEGFVCDGCNLAANRVYYRGDKRLCTSCSGNFMPSYSGAHEIRIHKKKYGISMTKAECERIKATRRNPDGSGYISNPRWK